MIGKNRRAAPGIARPIRFLLAALVFGVSPSWACVGDCNEDGTVTVDEVLTGVSIALGARPLAECSAFDGNSDAEVTVDEVIVALNNALGGCPDPQETPTQTPTAVVGPPTSTPTPPVTVEPTATATPTATIPTEIGPVVSYFGIASASGIPVNSSGTSAEGYPIFTRPAGTNGAGFLIVVEGRAGTSGVAVGQCNSFSDEFSTEARPDIQILSSRNLGAGNPAVCDGPVGPETGGCPLRPAFVQPFGGIPAVDPPDFDSPTRAVADALNDFGCRMAHFVAAEPCTKTPQGMNPSYVRPTPISTSQFCSSNVVGLEMRFPQGDTILTARLRDFAGNPGPQARIVVRVP